MAGNLFDFNDPAIVLPNRFLKEEGYAIVPVLAVDVQTGESDELHYDIVSSMDRKPGSTTNRVRIAQRFKHIGVNFPRQDDPGRASICSNSGVIHLDTDMVKYVERHVGKS